MIAIEINEAQWLNAVEKMFWLRNTPERRKSAIAVAASKMREKVVEMLKKEANLSAKEVESRVSIEANGDSVEVRVSKAPIPPKKFGAEAVKGGIRYTPSQRLGRRFIRGGFGLDNAKLGRNAFQRVSKTRYPIKKVQGESLADIAAATDLQQKIKLGFGELLANEFRRAAQREQASQVTRPEVDLWPF